MRAARTRARTARVVLGAAVALFAGGCTHRGGDDAASAPSQAARTPDDHGEADLAFARLMVPHHQMAIDMAALAESHGASEAVRLLAGTIRAAQQQQIARMQGWLAAWGDTPIDPHAMTGGMTEGMPPDSLESLQALQGPAFDERFLRLMIPHHQAALSMAEAELASGKSSAAKELARAIETSQSAEIDEMRQLLAR